MKLILDCESKKCQDLHKYDNVASVIIVTCDDGGKINGCDFYTSVDGGLESGYVAAVPSGNGHHHIFGSIAEKEKLWRLAEIIMGKAMESET